MGYLKEKVAYLKGLAEGANISDSTNEGKLLKALIDVLDDFALTVEQIEDTQTQICRQVDDMDEDLAEVEKVVFGSDDDDDEYVDDELETLDIECPHCGRTINNVEEYLSEGCEGFNCPHCHNRIEVDWECTCEDCDDDESEECCDDSCGCEHHKEE